ncbi:hypothetical protein E2C01_084845 [Portunus trituberculatus]|uniref:Uncharacterized protein n=1 Tax=Portunus trituberculatus TaxID=210409 RepID=A0A5B7J119_PORTR|nr:hypothetical protein [Portunus trituberculatus]
MHPEADHPPATRSSPGNKGVSLIRGKVQDRQPPDTCTRCSLVSPDGQPQFVFEKRRVVLSLPEQHL